MLVIHASTPTETHIQELLPSPAMFAIRISTSPMVTGTAKHARAITAKTVLDKE
jgi:hypothetical protein